MRLLTRSPAARPSCPSLLGPCGSTRAGRPCTSASTSATRSRSCSRCGCARLKHTGYDVQLAINITDVNDKIYEAAPGKSAELARNATEWYLEDTSGLGLGRPDFEPRATGTIPSRSR